jgi:hypothetical protein
MVYHDLPMEEAQKQYSEIALPVEAPVPPPPKPKVVKKVVKVIVPKSK